MIRSAQEQDLPEILDIYNDAIVCTTTVYEENVRTLAEQVHWFSEKKQGGFPVIVYEEDHRIWGFATFGLFGTMSGFKYSVKDSVYVHKSYRCRYVGTKLLRELIEIADTREYATMIAEIDAGNENSKILHEKLGFKNVGTICGVGYKFGRWLDLAVYQYQLKGPACQGFNDR